MALFRNNSLISIRTIFVVTATLFSLTVCNWSQQEPKPLSPAAAPSPLEKYITGSAAYAEILLKQADMSAELEALKGQYTDDYPRVGELKFSLEQLKRETDRLAKVKPADSGKLTPALGKLIVRKVDLETELWKLLQIYKDEHPDVKRARRRVEIFEEAIKEILG